jgi:ribosome-associated translation inhibitor RaiA
MKIGDIRVRYHGLHPSEYTKSHLDSAMQEIYDESPDGSSLQASFSKHKDVLKGIVQISSPAGHFFASATGPNLHDVANRLLAQMRRRLNKWKSKRFSSESLKHLFTPVTGDFQEEGNDSSVA